MDRRLLRRPRSLDYGRPLPYPRLPLGAAETEEAGKGIGLPCIAKHGQVDITPFGGFVKNQEVCLPLYCRMRKMDKDGKKLVAKFVYRHAV